MATDVYEIVLMGFAVTENVYQKTEYSYGYEEATIRELQYYRDPSFKFDGFVNTGAYNCEREGTPEPLANLSGHIRFQGSIYEKFNRYNRLAQTQKLRSSTGGMVYPTVALVFDGRDHLIGMIHFPDQYWSSFKSDFFKNLNFFLHPYDERYPQLSGAFKNGCQPPSGSHIIIVDRAYWDKNCAYEVEKQAKQQEKSQSANAVAPAKENKSLLGRFFKK